MSNDVEKLGNDFNTSASKQIEENPKLLEELPGESEFYNNLTTKVHEFWNKYDSPP